MVSLQMMLLVSTCIIYGDDIIWCTDSDDLKILMISLQMMLLLNALLFIMEMEMQFIKIINLYLGFTSTFCTHFWIHKYHKIPFISRCFTELYLLSISDIIL